MRKGVDYQRVFTERAHLAVMWTLERDVLDALVPEGSGADLDYLDFACGTGRILAHLEGRVRRAVGADVSPAMLSVARQRVNRANVYELDLTRTAPWPDGTFDLVTAFRFFPNAEPALRSDAMRAIRRQLRPGGRLVFNNHCHLGSVRNRLRRAARRRSGNVGMTDQEARVLASDHGFAVERVHALGCWPGMHDAPPAVRALWTAVERWLARHAPVRPVANNLIYVCRRI